MRRRLYTLKTRDEATIALGSDSRRNTASQSPLSGGTSVAEAVSLEPGQIRFEFFVAGDGAGRIATSFKELLNSDIGNIPFFGVSTETEFDGYYVAQSGSTRPLDAQVTGTLHRVDSVLEEAGTRRSHLRKLSLKTKPVDNPYGNDLTAHVGVPATAINPRWFNPTDETTSPTTPTETRTSQFGDVDIFDVAAAPTSESELVYDLPYSEAGKTDTRVWDSRGVSKLDGNSNVQWQRVFVTSHEYAGEVVVENGLVRLTMDDSARTITAETWDSGQSSWSSVSLGTSDWDLIDADLTHIGPVSVEAQLLFEDSVGGGQHAQNMRLTRGADVIQFTNPENESDSTPAMLQTLLSPIASTEAQSAGESLGLRDRKEVRR